MRKVMKWVYYCEYCSKSGRSASHMAKHEIHCTANPDRVCGLCKMGGLRQKPMDKLIKAVGACDAKGIKSLRKAASGCPACILSALRQSEANNYDTESFSFDYQSERKAFYEKHRKVEECNLTL